MKTQVQGDIMSDVYAGSRKSLRGTDLRFGSGLHNVYYAPLRVFFGVFRGKRPPPRTREARGIDSVNTHGVTQAPISPKFFSHPGVD